MNSNFKIHFEMGSWALGLLPKTVWEDRKTSLHDQLITYLHTMLSIFAFLFRVHLFLIYYLLQNELKSDTKKPLGLDLNTFLGIEYGKIIDSC